MVMKYLQSILRTEDTGTLISGSFGLLLKVYFNFNVYRPKLTGPVYLSQGFTRRCLTFVVSCGVFRYYLHLSGCRTFEVDLSWTSECKLSSLDFIQS